MFYRDIKLMHVTFYRCFDRLLGSWIINEFLKNIFRVISYYKHTVKKNLISLNPEIIGFLWFKWVFTVLILFITGIKQLVQGCALAALTKYIVYLVARSWKPVAWDNQPQATGFYRYVGQQDKQCTQAPDQFLDIKTVVFSFWFLVLY